MSLFGLISTAPGRPALLTPHQAKYIAHDLTAQHVGGGLERLSLALFNASVDLNPHQIEAAVFLPGSHTPDHGLLAENLLREMGPIGNQLVLLVGSRGSGKTQVLRQIGRSLGVEPLNLGLQLGARLAATPVIDRGFSTSELLRDLASHVPKSTPLLLDNLELLFGTALQINPLGLIKQIAHARQVIAVWPGELSNERLVYADINHPEHRDYSSDGVLVMAI